MHTLGICREAHYSERSTPAHLGPRLESPQGSFIHRADGWSRLSAETSAGLTQDTDTSHCGHFFTTSRFRFLMWYLRAPDRNARRKRNRSASFLRPGMGSWSRMTPLCSIAQQPRGPDFRDRTGPRPHSSAGRVSEREPKSLRIYFKTRTSAYKQMRSIFWKHFIVVKSIFCFPIYLCETNLAAFSGSLSLEFFQTTVSQVSE